MTYENQSSRIIQIFAGSFLEASQVQSLLEDNGIRATLDNAYMGSIAPWYVSPGGVDPVKVMISSNDHEEAAALIEQFNQTEG